MKFGAPLRRGSRWVIPIKVAKIIFKHCDDYYKLRHNRRVNDRYCFLVKLILTVQISEFQI